MATRAAWMRKVMQVWMVLAGIMFFAQCAQRAEPYLRVIWKKQDAAQHDGEQRAASRPHPR